jgi:hypothetical protein
VKEMDQKIVKKQRKEERKKENHDCFSAIYSAVA